MHKSACQAAETEGCQQIGFVCVFVAAAQFKFDGFLHEASQEEVFEVGGRHCCGSSSSSSSSSIRE
jgi:hypothetical protein